MFKHIIDKDTELRLLEMHHAEELFKLTDSCRAHLRRWLPWVDGTISVEDTRDFIEMTKRQFANNNGFQAGIWYKGRLAGVIGYHPINWANKSVGIGYWLGEEYQGKGIMIIACRALVDYAFNELKLHRVEIKAALENHRSRAIPERLGFKEEGILRESEQHGNRYLSLVVYGMLHYEWE